MREEADEGRPKPLVNNVRRKLKARRKLDFGPEDENSPPCVDPEEELAKHREELCNKYNFDFKNGVPLEGDFEWTIDDFFWPHPAKIEADPN